MTETDPLRPEDFEPHRSSPEGNGMRQGFSEMWREQPLIRLVIILVPVVAIVALVIGTMGSSKSNTNPSVVSRGSTVNDVPGTPGASPAYTQAVIDRNKQQQEIAEQTHGSSIPTPTAPEATVQTTAPTDPLAKFENAPPVVIAPTQQTATNPNVIATQATQQQQLQAQPQPPQIDQSLAQAMHQEMQSLMQSVVPKSSVITKVTSADFLAAQNQQAAAALATPVVKHEGAVILAAGQVLYGQTLTEANSDLSSPILVSILSGPFSGGRAIGSFQKPQNCDCIVLAFGTVIKDTVEYKVSAVAVDPETTSTGLVTDIDHHYFDRFVLPAAAGFLQGVGQSVVQSGQTVTSSSYGTTQTTPTLDTGKELLYGLGTGAQAISSALNQDANRPITIHVAGGTPIGMMFTSSVHENVDQ